MVQDETKKDDFDIELPTPEELGLSSEPVFSPPAPKKEKSEEKNGFFKNLFGKNKEPKNSLPPQIPPMEGDDFASLPDLMPPEEIQQGFDSVQNIAPEPDNNSLDMPMPDTIGKEDIMASLPPLEKLADIKQLPRKDAEEKPELPKEEQKKDVSKGKNPASIKRGKTDHIKERIDSIENELFSHMAEVKEKMKLIESIEKELSYLEKMEKKIKRAKPKKRGSKKKKPVKKKKVKAKKSKRK